jgi:hypothetical protein
MELAKMLNACIKLNAMLSRNINLMKMNNLENYEKRLI